MLILAAHDLFLKPRLQQAQVRPKMAARNFNSNGWEACLVGDRTDLHLIMTLGHS